MIKIYGRYVFYFGKDDYKITIGVEAENYLYAEILARAKAIQLGFGICYYAMQDGIKVDDWDLLKVRNEKYYEVIQK